MHVVQGVILLTSPFVILWKVRMELKKKIRLFMIWAAGLVVVLFGLMRMLNANFTSDVTWTYTHLLIWTSLDVSVGIVVISLPVLDAWLASRVRDAMTKMGRTTHAGGLGKNGYGNLDKSGFGTTKSSRSRATANASTSRDYDESNEDMFDKKEGIELSGIMRVDEYTVQFAPKDSREAGLGGQSVVSPGIGKKNKEFVGTAR